MTFNTGNPIGSTDARDLSDNAENFDKALNDTSLTWVDRLGVTRDTFEGRLAKGSFYRVGTFAAGYTLTNMRQTLEYNGHEYSWAGTFPKVVAAGSTPATSGGIGAGAWVDRPDLTLRSDILKRRTLYTTDYETLSDSVSFDNASGLSALFASLSDGDTVDFCGKSYRVLASVSGITAATANPTTDNALDLASCIVLSGKKRITLRNGVIYAANAGVSGTKMYFPSTVSFLDCEDLHFENFICEGKGESWGASDSSASETKARRLEFLATNGGHAAYFGRCKGVTGTLTTRLCGSVAPMYFSSCTDVKLESPFSNPASLGYAPYAMDAWVGSLSDVGFDEFNHFISNPTAFAETLYRREDGTTSVGSATYCGKGGIVTEDGGVSCYSIGGFIKDMYANGSVKAIGYAFGAGSGSVNKNIGATVRNCQEIAYLSWSTDDYAICEVLDVDAEVGLTGAFIASGTFGDGFVKLSGRIKVDGSRVWAGETNELAKTSIVANLHTVNTVEVELDLTTHEDSNIYSLITNESYASYGGVTLKGGSYITNGYLIRSVGWGNSLSGSMRGLQDEGSTIVDKSAQTDGYIQYTNLSPASVYTYINHDLSKTKIGCASLRPLGAYTINGTNLDEHIALPAPEYGCYVKNGGYAVERISDLECDAVVGLAGVNSLIRFYVKTNTIPAHPNSRIYNGANTHQILGYTAVAAGSNKKGVLVTLLLSGDVRSLYSAGSQYLMIA